MDENDSWQEKLVQEYLTEKRRKRRWSLFFKTLFFFLVILLLILFYPTKSLIHDGKELPHAALVDIRGTIFDGAKANADNVAKALHFAYQNKNTKGVIIRINSPGGSPVQADYIFNEIIRVRKQHPNIKVYAVCTDICTSAAYYIASACDQIYANPASLIGSIGVLYNGFGFTGILEKLGVERRLVTAGKNKGFMDPFSPVDAEQEHALKRMLSIIHQQFEDSVRYGRGKRLRMTDDIFSGMFWTGRQARQMGLIDEYGSAGYVARGVIKVKRIVDYTVKPSYLEKLMKDFGLNVTTSIAALFGLNQNGLSIY